MKNSLSCFRPRLFTLWWRMSSHWYIQNRYWKPVHAGPTLPHRLSLPEIEAHPRCGRGSAVALVHAERSPPPRPTRQWFWHLPHPLDRLLLHGGHLHDLRHGHIDLLPCAPHQRGRHLADSRPQGHQLRPNFLLRSCHWRHHASIVIPMQEEAPTSAVPSALRGMPAQRNCVNTIWDHCKNEQNKDTRVVACIFVNRNPQTTSIRQEAFHLIVWTAWKRSMVPISSIRINVPIIVSSAFLQHIQSRMYSPDHVNVSQWSVGWDPSESLRRSSLSSSPLTGWSRVIVDFRIPWSPPASSSVESSWCGAGEENPPHSPRKISCSSPQSGRSRIKVDVLRLWEDRSQQGCQSPLSRECAGNLSTTMWKMKLMARRNDRMIREKMDSRERKVEKSRRVRTNTWRHEDDTWHVMCARQTYDLSHACACKSKWKSEKMWRVRCAVHTPRRLQQTAVSCKRANCNKKKIAKSCFWTSLE